MCNGGAPSSQCFLLPAHVILNRSVNLMRLLKRVRTHTHSQTQTPTHLSHASFATAAQFWVRGDFDLAFWFATHAPDATTSKLNFASWHGAIITMRVVIASQDSQHRTTRNTLTKHKRIHLRELTNRRRGQTRTQPNKDVDRFGDLRIPHRRHHHHRLERPTLCQT